MIPTTAIMPIMRGHLINLMIVLGLPNGGANALPCLISQLPFEFNTGDMLGGIVLMAIAIFSHTFSGKR